MSKILIYSIPFGGGPIGKALVIADYLRQRHHVTLASFSHGIQLIRSSANYIDAIDTESRDIVNLRRLLDRGIDVFISVMDLTLAKLVKSEYPNTKTIFVDSLLSWRLREYSDEVWRDIDSVDLYISQYVPDISTSRIADVFGNSITRLHMVRPLLKKGTPASSRPSAGELVVHFGGLASPVIDYHRYSPFIQRTALLLLNHFSETIQIRFSSIGDVVSTFMPELQGFPNASFECLTYDKFQNVISAASLIVTTPGIETTYESVSLGCPVVFLPPVNSTQLHQLDFFRTAGLPSVVPPEAWPRLDHIRSADVPYRVKTLWLCDLVNDLSGEAIYSQRLINTISSLLSNKEERLRLCAIQERLIPVGLEDGLELIASFVNIANE